MGDTIIFYKFIKKCVVKQVCNMIYVKDTQKSGISTAVKKHKTKFGE